MSRLKKLYLLLEERSNNWILRSVVVDLKVKESLLVKLSIMPFWNSFGVAKSSIFRLIFVAVKSNGEIDLTHLVELLAQDVKSLVSLMHVNNEIGTVLDLHRVV
jgi:cysteine desulfurase